jgi:uncharacterized protein
MDVLPSSDVRRKSMPVPVSYPGVYVEEISSGVRTITGVATSITAFLGRTPRGPVNRASTIFSFGDFERQFGGLNAGDPMGYAVRDFFLNGGSQAVIVRLFHPLVGTPQERDDIEAAINSIFAVLQGDLQAAKAAATAKATEIKNSDKPQAVKDAVDAVLPAINGATTLDAAKAVVRNAANAYKALAFTINKDMRFVLEPSSPGSWAKSLRIIVDTKASPEVAQRFGVEAAKLFNLRVVNTVTGASERFLNLSFVESPRRIDRVLEAESSLIRWSGTFPPPTALPSPIPADEVGDELWTLENKLKVAEQALKDALEATKAMKETERNTARDNLKSALDALIVPDSLPLVSSDYLGSESKKTGIYALEDTDLFNILCIPPDQREASTSDDKTKNVYSDAMAYCVKRRAFLLVDPRSGWREVDDLVSHASDRLSDLGLNGDAARNAAVFYPRVLQADPLRDGFVSSAVPCGIIAGLMARTDAQRGVWKAPAGIDAGLNGISGLEVTLTDGQNGALNQVGINCLRTFPIYGRVAWGSRTLRGADQAADEYKYIPVRRTALFIEESLFRGLKWVVFEPNDEPLWSQIRLNVGAFMNNLFRQGAFQGKSPRDAYFVKCDRETTTQNDINLGIVNVVVGFAPLKPAEFVIVKLQQMAGQIEV